MSCVYKSASSRCHQKCISFCIVFWWTNHLHTCGIHLDSYYHLVVTEHQRYWGSQSMGCDETLCARGGLLLQHSSGVPPLEIFFSTQNPVIWCVLGKNGALHRRAHDFNILQSLATRSMLQAVTDYWDQWSLYLYIEGLADPLSPQLPWTKICFNRGIFQVFLWTAVKETCKAVLWHLQHCIFLT